MSERMRAVIIERNGGTDVLRLEQVPVPVPGSGEVAIEVAAAGVNYVDTYVRSGLYPVDLPHTMGREGAGIITAVGGDVADFAPGDRVAWAMSSGGGYAERVVVAADLVVPVPDDIELTTAAAAMLQGMTAHFLARSIVPFRPGDVALVHAGAGGVGLLLTQILTRDGVRVLTTTSSADKAALSRGAGAEAVVGYDDFETSARTLTDGVGVRAVFDGVGAATFDRGLDCLRPRGTFVLFGGASGPVPPLDPQLLNTKGSLMLTRPALNAFIADRQELLWRAGEVLDAIGDGWLDIRVGNTYGLDDAAQAHADLEARRTTGKLLLTPR